MSRNDTGDRIIARHDDDTSDGPEDEPRHDERGGTPPAEFSGEFGSRPGGGSTIGRGGDVMRRSSGAPGEAGRPSDPGNRTVGGPDEEPRETRRSALDMAPGIPAGDGNDLERALETEDRELGGAVAGDTTPGGATEDAPDEEQVRRDDRKRTTL